MKRSNSQIEYSDLEIALAKGCLSIVELNRQRDRAKRERKLRQAKRPKRTE